MFLQWESRLGLRFESTALALTAKHGIDAKARALLTFVSLALDFVYARVMAETTSRTAGGVRARVRAELTAEIKAVATRELADKGAAALSLRAIARELDMASSAIYRYFASRDELLTALIIDAYNKVGEAVEQADSTQDRDDYRGRFTAIASAIRSWAITNPHEYALIYGSPVPGYAAPEDTIDPAIRVSVALINTLVDAAGDDQSADSDDTDSSDTDAANTGLAAALADVLAFTDHRLSPRSLARGIEAWGEIFGLISLELFGHFHNAVTDPEAFFNHAVDAMAERALPD